MELQKIKLKLSKDYYPVTETLCSNACIQANWLHTNSGGMTIDQTTLFDRLHDKVKQHTGLSMAILHAPIDTYTAEKINACISILETSRQDINSILSSIPEKNIFQQSPKNEMLDNLRITTTVINNILAEIFKIEQEEIFPLLQEQF